MKARAVAFALTGGLLVAVAGAAPTSATTQVSAVSSPILATFAAPWSLELQVSALIGGFSPIINESSGSVDVFLEQVPGTFLDDLAIQANGRVFVTQPPDQPWLAPGTYDLRAVFTPAAGSELDAGQVRIPSAITIEPIELRATVSVETNEARVAMPTVSLSLDQQGDDAIESLPVGVWNLTLREAAGAEELLSRQVVQTSTPEPIVVELADDLRPGVDHVLIAEFVPVPEYAPGVVVTGAGEVPFRTAEQGFGQALVSPIDVPVWALVLALAGLLVGIAGLVIALIARSRRQKTQDAEAFGMSQDSTRLADEIPQDSTIDDDDDVTEALAWLDDATRDDSAAESPDGDPVNEEPAGESSEQDKAKDDTK